MLSIAEPRSRDAAATGFDYVEEFPWLEERRYPSSISS